MPMPSRAKYVDCEQVLIRITEAEMAHLRIMARADGFANPQMFAKWLVKIKIAEDLAAISDAKREQLGAAE